MLILLVAFCSTDPAHANFKPAQVELNDVTEGTLFFAESGASLP